MAFAQSVRNLMTGSGTYSASLAIGKYAILTFANSQFFWPGETVKATSGSGSIGVCYTVAWGSDKIWYSMQPCIEGITNGNFQRTDTSTSRARGGASGNYWIPSARYYFYKSLVDNGGVADWYCYSDTVAPVRGKHPYTKDQYTGMSWLSAKQTTQVVSASFGPVQDVANRIAALDGEDPVVY